MNFLKLKSLAAALAVVCSLAFASTTSAVTLAVGDAYYLGSVNPSSPANPDNEEDYIDFIASIAPDVIAPFNPVVVNSGGKTYTRSTNVFGALPAADFDWKFNNDDKVTPPIFQNVFTLSGTTDYILGKYGQTSHVWYVAGLVGSVTVPASITNELSHTSFFGSSVTRVPDSASTLLLIGLGLASVSLMARRRKA